MKPSELEELREKLASIEHERWADWQKWCHKILRANIKHDIEPTLARWEKQIATPYSKLTRGEQLSDLEQVDRYWHLIEEYIQQEKNKLLDELMSELPKEETIVTLTEPPQGIDRLWLEGRDYGVAAGYNQYRTQVVEIIKGRKK